MSFFMLLVVSMGLSVVKESLGRTMLRCQILAGAHFIFGSKCENKQSPAPILTTSSSILRWYCRALLGVDVCLGSSYVCHTLGIHPQRFPPLDYVFSKWYVILTLCVGRD